MLGEKQARSVLLSLLLLESWDQVLQVQVLNHLDQSWVLSDILEVLDLDLGALWDEVHLALTLLL